MMILARNLEEEAWDAAAEWERWETMPARSLDERLERWRFAAARWRAGEAAPFCGGCGGPVLGVFRVIAGVKVLVRGALYCSPRCRRRGARLRHRARDLGYL